MRSGTKQAVSGSARRVEWPDVIRALENDETRSVVLNRFRSRGFNAESFRLRSAKEALADALSHGEDWLEMNHGRRLDEREALKAVRRRLEWEIYGRG